MKLQLSDSAIRLRLSEAEVQAFAQAGQLVCALALGSGQGLRYALRRLPATDPAPALRARYAADELVVEVPATEAEAWARSGNISLKGAVIGFDGQPIRILVERDLGPSH